MFDNLRRAFQEAVENFKTELSRDEIPEAVDDLLRGMRREATDAQAYVHSLEEDVKKALRQAEAERKEAATCRRREEMARKIDDDETARVAAQFAEKHETRQRVLERKALALKEEMEVRKEEVERMLEKIKEARAQRDTLAATGGRTSARDSIRQGEDLLDELDRMAGEMDDEARRDRAEQDLDLDRMAAEDFEEELYGRNGEADVESRLRELKRRMGEED